MKVGATIFCWLSIGVAALVARAQERPDSEDSEPPSRAATLHEALDAVGMGESFFAGFADGQPISDGESQKIWALLDRLERFPLNTIDRALRAPRGLQFIAQNPSEARGAVYVVPGYVAFVERLELPPEARDKFSFEAVYRCRMLTLLGVRATVYTLQIPQAWKLDTPMHEFSRVAGMFLKVLPAPPGR